MNTNGEKKSHIIRDFSDGYSEIYNLILKDGPNPVIIHDEMGRIVYENKKSIQRAGGPLLGKSIKDFVHPDDYMVVRSRAHKVLNNGKVDFKEVKLIDCNGNVFDAEICGAKIKLKSKSVILTVYHDITERKAVEKALIETEDKYRSLVEGALVGIYLYQDNKFVYINPLLQDMLGYTLEELNEKGLLNIIAPKDRGVIQNNLVKAYKGQKFVTAEVEVITKKGQILNSEAKASTISCNGSIALIGTVTNVTERKKAEARINYLASYDALTGLPNRNMLNDLFNKKINEINDSNRPMTLMLLDLDRFTLINHTYGPQFGDLLLQQVAILLARCINEQDLIVRYSGDEFIILLQNTNERLAQEVALKIVNGLSKPFIVNKEEIYISASIGIAQYPKHGDDLETLIKNADSTLHLIKQNGRNDFKVYSPSISQDLPRIVQLEHNMRRAIQQNELVLHYQPLVSLESNKIIGAEALIRWEHPKLGTIPPLEFIPLAEENGMIVSIGQWVLETACRQNKLFQKNGLPEIMVAVNVSRRQFKDLNFVKIVKEILEKTELEPKYLELEITESMTQDIEQTFSIVKELRDIGVNIAIDDFGTGYSSLSVLKQFPINTLKIDKSFIQDITSNSALVKMIIDMAHTLEFKVIAEGIEDDSQYKFLKNYRCEVGQGFLLGKPIPPTDFLAQWV